MPWYFHDTIEEIVNGSKSKVPVLLRATSAWTSFPFVSPVSFMYWPFKGPCDLPEVKVPGAGKIILSTFLHGWLYCRNPYKRLSSVGNKDKHPLLTEYLTIDDLLLASR